MIVSILIAVTVADSIEFQAGFDNTSANSSLLRQPKRVHFALALHIHEAPFLGADVRVGEMAIDHLLRGLAALKLARLAG